MQVTCVSAANLLAADRNGFSDPYVVLNIKDQQEKVYSKFIENSLNPEWNETINLNGVDQGKDVVEIWVYDKDKKVDLKKNDIIGYQSVKVPEIQWGEEMEFQLLKVSKRKADKKSKPGDAGSIKLIFNTNKVEKTMALHVRVIAGKDLPKSDLITKSDPYCICKLGNEENKTKVCENTFDPQWNEEFHYFGVKKEDELVITVMDKDVLKDDKMGYVTIKVADLKEGELLKMNTKLLMPRRVFLFLLFTIAIQMKQPSLLQQSVKLRLKRRSTQRNTAHNSHLVVTHHHTQQASQVIQTIHQHFHHFLHLKNIITSIIQFMKRRNISQSHNQNHLKVLSLVLQTLFALIQMVQIHSLHSN